MAITIRIHNGTIRAQFKNSDSFSEIITVLKKHQCKFNATAAKDWTIPLHKYDQVLEDLQDYDIVDISLEDDRALQALRNGASEFKLSSERLLFNQSLLKAPPRPGKPPYEDYQLRDILRAINRNRYGLFLHMGMGKAYISAAIVAHLRHYGLAYKVLLISSNIGAANQMHELLKFTHLDPSEIVSITKIPKPGDPSWKVFDNPATTVVVTNYNTFRNICNRYYDEAHPRTKIKVKTAEGKTKTKSVERNDYKKAVLPLQSWLGGQPGILLLDESHALANPSSDQSKRVLSHLDYFEYRYLFTGTPADKNEKLYTQCRILDPALVHNLSYTQWCAEYNQIGNKFSPYAINPDGWRYEKLKALNEKLTASYAIFREKKDVLDIPDNYIKKLYLDMSPEHKRIYEAFVQSTLSHLKEEKEQLLTRDVWNTFPYLQIALDNPKILAENHLDLISDELETMIKKFSFTRDHVKFQATEDILDQHCTSLKEKGIVWIFHPATAKILQEELSKYNPVMIVGETPEAERHTLLQKFRTDPSCQILIASIPVLNTSVTITEAKFQVYFERVYNYAQYSQSMARISRIGQDKETITYILLADYSIDVLLDINLSTKDSLTNKLLSKSFLSLQEWRRLFKCTEGFDL